MNEWELLVLAEDIKKGDWIIVDLECGTYELMKLVKWTEKYVTLKDQFKELVRFRADTLESKYDGSIIRGKYFPEEE